MGIDNNNNQNDGLDLQFVRDLNSTRELDSDKMLQAEKEANKRSRERFSDYLNGIRKKAAERRNLLIDMENRAMRSGVEKSVKAMNEEIEAARTKAADAAEEEVRARWEKIDPNTRQADPKRQKIDQAMRALLRDYEEKNR